MREIHPPVRYHTDTPHTLTHTTRPDPIRLDLCVLLVAHVCCVVWLVFLVCVVLSGVGWLLAVRWVGRQFPSQFPNAHARTRTRPLTRLCPSQCRVCPYSPLLSFPLLVWRSGGTHLPYRLALVGVDPLHSAAALGNEDCKAGYAQYWTNLEEGKRKRTTRERGHSAAGHVQRGWQAEARGGLAMDMEASFGQ